MDDTHKLPLPPRSQTLLDELSQRVIVADGAMGTMLQDAGPTLDDFLQLEGCNEILNDTRPDIVESIHDAYFEVGVDCVETNTFGANWSNLSDYGIDERIEELSQKGAEIARKSAEKFEAQDGRMRWVLGSMGPAPNCPHWVTPTTPSSNPPLSAKQRVSSRVAPMRLWSKPHRTCCKPKQPSTAARTRCAPPARGFLCLSK